MVLNNNKKHGRVDKITRTINHRKLLVLKIKRLFHLRKLLFTTELKHGFMVNSL